MYSFKETWRRGITHVMNDDNKYQEELETIREELEEWMKMQERVIKSINSIGGKLDIIIYSGILNPEELIDWIGEMEFFFSLRKLEIP